MSIDLYPYRTALRRYGLASIATHQYPSDSTAIEQEAAARALVDLITQQARADERRRINDEVRKAASIRRPDTAG